MRLLRKNLFSTNGFVNDKCGYVNKLVWCIYDLKNKTVYFPRHLISQDQSVMKIKN